MYEIEISSTTAHGINLKFRSLYMVWESCMSQYVQQTYLPPHSPLFELGPCDVPVGGILSESDVHTARRTTHVTTGQTQSNF